MGVVAGSGESVTALRGVALRLDYMIGQITPGEFHWQDANYDRDSALGRELLYLIANSDWMRATSEEISIVRSDVIDTIIRIDVDLDRITNQVFADRAGQLWLPVLVLPPLVKPQPKRPSLAEPLSEPDPFSTLTVTDANGTPLITLPNAEIRHRLAAALAEIIISIAGARRPDTVAGSFSPTREHRLLLAAAIYRLLRGEHVPTAVLSRQTVARKPAEGQLARIDRARNEVGNLLAFYADHLDDRDPRNGQGSATARELAKRATRVLRALAESAVVVVAVDRKAGRAVMTVTAPSRALHLAPARWARVVGPVTESAQRWARPDGWRWLHPGNWVLPRASLEIDLLLPSADADRQIRVGLPDGVSPDPSVPLEARADLDIRTEPPVQLDQLAKLTGQLISVKETWPTTLCQSLADLCVAKADAAWATLRDHRVGVRPGELPISPQESTQATRAFRGYLDQLGEALGHISAGNQDRDAWEKLEKLWRDEGWRNIPMQRRTLSDTISPDAVTARARVIEDASKRAVPAEARMQVHVAVTDSEYVSTATLTGWMNTLLMVVVFGLFASEPLIGLAPGRGFSAGVLSFVLTLFAAIQVGRIERNDRSTLRGLLLPAGNPLIVLSILPPVVLASALAFMPSRAEAVIWAGASIGAQLTLLSVQRLLLWRAFARGRRPDVTAKTAPKTGLVFYTDTPYYQHYEVLHSAWWRSTTSEALMIGRRAHGYVVWQHGNRQTLRSLLTGGRPANEAQPPSNRSQTSRLPDWLAARLTPSQFVSGRSAGGASHPDHNGGRSGAHERDDDLGISALEQPASILGLQRIGTGSQSINFAVFRDEPKADWDCLPEDIVKVNFDPGRLAPAEGWTGIIRIFLGFQPGLGLLPIGDHPVTAVLEAAARHRLSVVEAQIPVPAPATAYADLQWARVRLGFAEATIGRLMPMLADLQELARKADNERQSTTSRPAPLIVGVQTVSDGIPRILNPRPTIANPGPRAGLGGRRTNRLVLASELDVVSISNVRSESAHVKTWRIMAICADWRPGIEVEILKSLGPGLCVVGLSALTLHGKAVVLLIGHHPNGPDATSAPQPAGSDHSGIEVYLDKWQSRNELGTVQRHPVLRVHMRTPDRPGATLEILQSLRDSLQDIAPGWLGMHDWNVWYARAVVAEGNTARIELTIRLSVDPDSDSFPGKPVGQWGPAEYTKIERQALALAASKMAAARQAGLSPELGTDTPEDTVIRVSLATIPDLTSEREGGTQGVHGLV